ncbi:MAG: hypothetical protein RL605_524 [Actinomycetota bacterium]|jgi:hypothetical protein
MRLTEIIFVFNFVDIFILSFAKSNRFVDFKCAAQVLYFSPRVSKDLST